MLHQHITRVIPLRKTVILYVSGAKCSNKDSSHAVKKAYKVDLIHFLTLRSDHFVSKLVHLIFLVLCCMFLCAI